MKNFIFLIILSLSININCKQNTTKVVMRTSLGDIHLELYNSKSPETVKNFLKYVDDKFYDGTIFHRVMANFMIQGGGFTADMAQKNTMPPIKNEADNGLKNKRGTIAMARTQSTHSATSQFFINVVDNTSLDHGNRGYGYCVFGHVTKGMDVLDRIKSVETETMGPHQNVPVESVVIHSIIRQQKGRTM